MRSRPVLALLLAVHAAAQTGDLTATFVDDDGAPVPGVEVRVHPTFSGSVLLGQAVSDARGQVRLPLATEALGIQVDARSGGELVATWRWTAREGPWDGLDLGEVLLSVGGTVVGRVFDPGGEGIAVDWRVEAASYPFGAVPPEGTVDPATGELRLEDVSPGSYELRATTTGGLATRVARVEVEAGAEHVVELVYDGPDPRRALPLSVDAHPHTLADEATFEVTAADGTRSIHEVRLSSSPFHRTDVLEDLGPGPYRVELVDPRLEDLVLEDVPAGELLRTRVVGAASLRLEAVDGDGRIVAWRGLNLTEGGRVRHSIRGGAGTAMRGLLPGRCSLQVLLEGRAPVPFEVELVAREVVEHRLLVPPARDLEVLLRRPDGRPAPGVPVELTRGPVAGVRGWRPSEDRPTVADHGTSDPFGRMRFPGYTPGTYALRAHFHASWAPVTRRVELRDADLSVELTSPPTGRLVPEVVLPERVEAEGLAVESSLRITPHPTPRDVRIEPITVPLAPGAASPIRVPAGEYDVSLHCRLGGKGGTLRLARERVEAGEETDARLDLRGRLPALVELHVRVDGRPAGVAEAHWTGADRAGLLARRAGVFQPATETSPARLLLYPGRYHLSLAGEGWIGRADCAVPGSRPLELTLSRVRRRLRVIDAATGERVAAVACRLVEDDIATSTSLAAQPAAGWPVAFTAGSLSVVAEGYAGATLRWSEALADPVLVGLEPEGR